MLPLSHLIHWSWPKVTPHLASNKMVNIALNCPNIQLEKRRKGLRNVFTMFLKIGRKKFYGFIICVCVCVCVWERERERERSCIPKWTHNIDIYLGQMKEPHLARNYLGKFVRVWLACHCVSKYLWIYSNPCFTIWPSIGFHQLHIWSQNFGIAWKYY
jgi:hypothetical protein